MPRLCRLAAAALLVVMAGALQVELSAGSASAAPAPTYFTGWDSLGTPANGAPAVTTWGPGRLDVFVNGPGQTLWHRWYQGAAWVGWENLGAPAGGLASDPAAVAWSSGRIDVMAKGANGHLWNLSYSGSWSAWQDLGGSLLSAPAVSSWGPGRLDVFVEGTDRALYHRALAGQWLAWERIGGVLNSAPAATSWGAGRIDVVARGTDLAAWHTYFDGAWHGFDSLGGVLSTKPSVSTSATAQLDVYATGDDGALWHQNFQAGWAATWQRVGGGLTSGPASVSWGPGRADIFARGTDGAVWHVAQLAGGLPAPGWQTAVAVATAQLGKPYQWAGAGPNSFDCSGLTRWAWAAAGVALPHLAQGQYDMTRPVAIADLQPGDLVFYGTPSSVYHVGIYIGNGDMIHASHTGEPVLVQSIFFSGLLAGGRVS